MNAECKPLDVLKRAIEIAKEYATEPGRALCIVPFRMDEIVSLCAKIIELVDADVDFDALLAELRAAIAEYKAAKTTGAELEAKERNLAAVTMRFQSAEARRRAAIDAWRGGPSHG